MIADDEKWQKAGNDGDAEMNGNQFNNEGYRAPRTQKAYGDGARPYRPRFTPNAERVSSRPRYNNDNTEGGERPQRSYNSYNNNYNQGERPYRPRYNAEGGEEQRSFRPRYNAEGGEEQRSFRPRYNAEGGEEQRSFRPRYNAEGGERPQRSYNNHYNNGGGYNNNRGGYRPRYNNDGEGGERQQRGYSSYNNNYNQGERSYRPRYNNDGEADGQQRFGGERGGFRPRYNQDGPRRYGNNGGYGRPQQRRSADYDPNAKYSKRKQIEYREMNIDPDAPIRLNKFLANAGVCSRREADEFIQAGVVSVNGVVVSELGTKIKRNDEVKFHDQPVSIERKVYVLLNKPKDTVTTSDDPQARKTVMDLVKGACPERIYPVGRLDRNTTGVLLLTNDGDLASKLTHPKFMKKKIYKVRLDKDVTRADLDSMLAGIELEDGEIRADEVSYVEDKKDEIGIEIHSGKNRIVRRIFEHFGYRVLKLDRVFFAGLTKKGLRRGDWRFLTQLEVNFLKMGSFE